jgi:hypothetical protein
MKLKVKANLKKASFTPEQLEKLKSAYENKKSMDPEDLTKFHALFEKLNDEELQQLIDSKVNFVSGLARNALNRRTKAKKANREDTNLYYTTLELIKKLESNEIKVSENVNITAPKVFNVLAQVLNGGFQQAIYNADQDVTYVAESYFGAKEEPYLHIFSDLCSAALEVKIPNDEEEEEESSLAWDALDRKFYDIKNKVLAELKQMIEAHINFVSGLARNALNRRTKAKKANRDIGIDPWGSDREVQRGDRNQLREIKSKVVQFAYELLQSWGLAGKRIADLFSDPQLKKYSYKIRTEIENFLKQHNLLDTFKQNYGNNISDWFAGPQPVIARSGELTTKIQSEKATKCVDCGKLGLVKNMDKNPDGAGYLCYSCSDTRYLTEKK